MALTRIKGSNIADGTVVEADIADNSVTATKLDATLDLSSKSVTLASGAVTPHVTDPTKASIEALGIDVPATDLTGTIPDARFPATLPAIDGSSLTGISMSGGLKSQQVFTASGTWTKPAGISKIRVYVTGGGSGGGSGNPPYNASPGGGAGATAIKFIDVSAISSVSVTVGGNRNGGSAGQWTQSGGAGYTSSFGAHCSATGGTQSYWDNSGRGGTATGGDINLTGGDGGNFAGLDNSTGGCGGGSYWGSGGQGGSGGGGAGNAGPAYGSGGGAGTANSNTSGGGGMGRQGIVVVEEYS